MINDQRLQIYNVFTPTRFPIYSYVSRQANYEQDIEHCVQTGIIAFIHGPTKSGKSVLAEKAAQGLSTPSHKISARNFRSPNEFWETVASQLGIQEAVTTTRSATKGTKRTMTWLAKITAWFAAEASASGTVEKQLETGETITQTIQIDPALELEKQSRNQGKRHTIIIDNFHYIQDSKIQRELLQELRNLLDHVSIIIIAITEKPDYLNSIEPELIGRCSPITIQKWTDQELMEIAYRGFLNLNIELSPVVRQELHRECVGAPAIMQAICLHLGLALGYKFPAEKRQIVGQDQIKTHLKKACKDTARMFDMTQTYDALLKLANYSTELPVMLRAQRDRNLLDDQLVFPIEAILQAIISRRNNSITLSELKQSYEKIILRRKESLPIFEKALSDLQIAGELVWQASIKPDSPRVESKDGKVNTDVEIGLMIWNETKQEIILLDPYFVFYIRWSGRIKGIV